MSNLKIFINKFKETNFDYFLLNSSDEFLNEYISESEMKLKWLTNFSGSNGLALIGKNKNYFFTDGRYTLQAKKEIDHSFKIIETSEQNFMDFAKQNLFDKKILLDLKTFDYQFIIRLKAIILSKSGIISHDRNELINFLWKDRPTKIKHQIFKLSTIFCGRTVKQKIKDLVFKSNFQTFILTSPDSINWLFNIRGYDLEHSPIAFTRAIITKDKIFIFIDLKKVSKKLFKSTKYLNFISILKFESYLKKLKKNDKIFLDSNVSYYYYQILKKYNTNLTIGIDPCKIMKSKKNEAEIKCSKRAHLNDGISLTKFFYWLSNQTFDYKLTEYSVAQKLETFRKENSDFFSISFPTISATGSNGSIIHYKPDSKKMFEIKKR